MAEIPEEWINGMKEPEFKNTPWGRMQRRIHYLEKRVACLNSPLAATFEFVRDGSRKEIHLIAGDTLDVSTDGSDHVPVLLLFGKGEEIKLSNMIIRRKV